MAGNVILDGIGAYLTHLIERGLSAGGLNESGTLTIEPETPMKDLIEITGPASVGAWYDIFGSEGKEYTAADGTKYRLTDFAYVDDGKFDAVLKRI